jgi:hypothetical protein
MAFLLRQTGIILAIGLLVLCTSCEKHPLGKTREVQEEQVDPEKASSEASETRSEKSSSSPTPAEFFPANTLP